MIVRSSTGHDHPHGIHTADADPSLAARRLGWAILLNSLFIALELTAGFTANSLALLSDAWHNFADVLGLGIAWFAVRQIRRPPDSGHTFGHHRAGILAALGNSLFLAVVTLSLGYEAVQRLGHPPPSGGWVIAVVAAIGVLLNGGVAFALRGGGGDLNLQSAFLHMLGDALVSLGVVLAGVSIIWTGWDWLDPATCLLVSVFILASAWRIVREAVNILMEGTPRDLDVKDVGASIAALPGVRGVHHLHVWSLGGDLMALSCHVIVEDQPVSAGGLLVDRIQRELQDRFRISHSTIQLETAIPASTVPLPICYGGEAAHW
ncbi:MAG TPA: cation diffusion facilitator family transporter [Candidatus Acidoferrum sp.]|nr:cation diffusion facilitator family transporter [Candidatus Methylomirabilis sp.]HWU41014.1 cation diffusion facilitator family transporter [Candidatus Acidoferrum sp.]